ncbi:MAG: hypothetical protein ACXVH7_07150 [Thermoanaerobaculia bacterium]
MSLLSSALAEMSLTFVVGAATDVFGAEFARAVDSALKTRFPAGTRAGEEAYRSDVVEAGGWGALQFRAADLLGGTAVPQIASVEAYQAVYVPSGPADVEHIAIPNAADPLQVGNLDALLDELRAFATSAELPTDDVELMNLAARYLEDDDAFDSDLDVQTYVQLMLSAKQAAARKQPLWIVV